MRADSSGPMPAIGSSSSTRRGRLASAMPTSSARCSPCESWSMRASALSARPSAASSARARSNSACSARTGRQAAKLAALRGLHRERQVVEHRQALEQPRDLERARQAAPRALVRDEPRDVVRRRRCTLPAVAAPAGRRAAPPAWSCPRRSGRSARGSRRRDLQIDAIGGDQAAEALAQAAHVEQRRAVMVLFTRSQATARRGPPAPGARTAPPPAAPSRSRSSQCLV